MRFEYYILIFYGIKERIMLNFRLEEKRMLENFVNQINKNAKIAIYGAGNAGSGIKEYIEKSRPDIKILFFVDA